MQVRNLSKMLKPETRAARLLSECGMDKGLSEVDASRKRLESFNKNFRITKAITCILILVIVLVILGGFEASLVEAVGRGDLNVFNGVTFKEGVSMAAGLGLAVMVASMLESHFEAKSNLLPELEPIRLKESACREALSLVKLSEIAREWRDFVVSNDRMLLVGDLLIMKELIDAEKREEKEEELKLACNELHGLDTGAPGSAPSGYEGTPGPRPSGY